MAEVRLDARAVYGRRFGFGAGAEGDAASLARRLIAEIDAADASLPGDLPSTEDALRLAFDRSRQTQERTKGFAERFAAGLVGADEKLSKIPLPTANDMLARELAVRIAAVGRGEHGFTERLASFWANHFTVSANRAPVGIYAGPFEREALRANQFGSFANMVVAATLHPAMLTYLDNVNSIGAKSPDGQRRRKGLNENLGREVLELHTLGADGGYTQGDVIELAKALSGWTVDVHAAGADDRPWHGFMPDRHEPGERVILGKRYPDSGERQIVAILRDLASHPSTARHLGRKLMVHFIGSAGSPDVAEALRSAFLAGKGALSPVYRALVNARSAWTAPARKIRPPQEFVMIALGWIGDVPRGVSAMAALKTLGQPYFRADSPKGWPDEDDAWATAEGIKTRLDWTAAVARQVQDPNAVVERALASMGPTLLGPTRQALARAETPQGRLALLLMSPDVQRR